MACKSFRLLSLVSAGFFYDWLLAHNECSLARNDQTQLFNPAKSSRPNIEEFNVKYLSAIPISPPRFSEGTLAEPRLSLTYPCLTNASLFVLLLTFSGMSLSAIGVTAESVTKWETAKLCTRKTRYEEKADWEAVTIVISEIAARDIDLSLCDQIGEEELERKTGTTRKRRTSNPSESTLNHIQTSIEKAYDRYGDRLYKAVIKSACKNEPFDWDLVDKARDYAVSKVPKKHSGSANLAGNQILYQVQGFLRGVRYSAILVPGLCERQDIEDAEGVVAKSFSRPNYTQQNVEHDPELGIDKAQIIAEIGAPIYSEKSALTEEAHYCRTGEGDEFLVLFYFEEKLMAKAKYHVSFDDVGRSGDCKEFVKEGSYAIPLVIEALNKSVP